MSKSQAFSGPRIAVLGALVAVGATAVAAGPAERRFQFVYEVAIKAVPESQEQAYLWLPYPQDSPEQDVENIRVDTTRRHEIVTEPRYGNRALRIELKPGAVDEKVTLRFDVARKERLNRPGQGEPLSSVGLAADPQLWLKADARVPIDGQIGKWARETVGDHEETTAMARAIYDHTVTNLKYDKSGTGWGRGDILWACDNKRGNCTDFHAVFIGYSRALGVPARFEIGFPLPPARGKGEIGGYHCWAQFHDKTRGWVPIDASEASKSPEKRDYFFGALDENRVLMTVGRDIVLPGMKGEALNFFIYPYAEVDGKPVADIARRFTFEDLAAPVAPAAR